VRRGLGPTAQLTAIDGVVVASHDERRQANRQHGRHNQRERSRHLGHHQHHRERAREMLPKQAIIPTMT